MARAIDAIASECPIRELGLAAVISGLVGSHFTVPFGRESELSGSFTRPVYDGIWKLGEAACFDHMSQFRLEPGILQWARPGQRAQSRLFCAISALRVSEGWFLSIFPLAGFATPEGKRV